ncbi:streptophobe family protein [Kitasatospora sp. NPDC048298]|uniref:streptophobe family protein n=1 Tax=Kitasatospora sp. NPDC048298 TaxID=3364049 RepID=UPI00371D2603
MPVAPPRPVPPRTLWRHVLEGALSTVAALVAMAAAAWAALTALGAGAIAPASGLVPALMGMAFGGDITVKSAASAGSGGDGGLGGLGFGGGLGGLLGGLGGGGGGGLNLGLTGLVSMTPLTLTFLGTAVLAIGFFRPLYRRPQPASEMLWARFGGAVSVAAVAFPLLAGAAHGTARLPESVTERFGKGGSSGALGRFGGAGGGGSLTSGLSSVVFDTDTAVTVFFGLLWVCAVLGIGCVAARRTTLSRALTLGPVRLRWHAVTSTVTGIAAVLCCTVLAVALVAGVAALTGREQAAKAAGALLLLGPNLLAVLLTSGLGTPWEAGTHRLKPQGGGMFGMFGGADQGDAAGADKSLSVGGWSGAGLPVWLIGLLLVLLLAVVAGYVTAARTPARTRREESRAVFSRHVETAMRLGVALGLPFLLLPLAAGGSLRIGVSLMGNEMGGMTAGLDGRPGLSALAAVALGALAGYGGSRLHERRARRRDLDTPAPEATPRRAAPTPARSASSRSSSEPAS